MNRHLIHNLNLRSVMNALVIAELLEQCIDFLAGSEPDIRDLRACSLVGRSWVRPAQYHIFSTIRIEHRTVSLPILDPRAPRLLDILDASPHLIGCISALYIEVPLAPPNLLRFLNLPFTRLSSLHLGHYTTLLPEGAVSLKRLLSAPTLLSLDIGGNVVNREQFLRIWEHSSPTIKHLALSCNATTDQTAPYVDSAPRRHIRLDSFEIDSIKNIEWWLGDPRCPLDFSSLRALKLRMSRDVRAITQGPLAAQIEKVKVLALGHIRPITQSVDLSGFEQLTDLCLQTHPRNPASPFETLLTIRPESRPYLSVLRFIMTPARDNPRDSFYSFCSLLDRALADLPVRDQFPNLTIMHITVFAATPVLTMSADSDYFPLLDPRILVQWSFRPRTPPPWYRSIV
ncbi:hypothetical protein FB451DRAFT_1291588 [Mycena latifolia]|nr:hypothetical protein FB451DRAFT_1291588 [Mycena latifolia]